MTLLRVYITFNIVLTFGFYNGCKNAINDIIGSIGKNGIRTVDYTFKLISTLWSCKRILVFLANRH